MNNKDKTFDKSIMKYNGSNYLLFENRMMELLEANALDGFLTESEPEPQLPANPTDAQRKKLAQWKQRRAQALVLIKNNCDEVRQTMVQSIRDPKEVMDVMKQNYLSKKPANQNRLLGEFQNFKFNVAKDFSAQFNILENLALTLKELDVEKSTTDLKFAVLNGLPDDDEYFEKYLASWELKDSLTYDHLKEQLLSIEKKGSFSNYRKSLRQDKTRHYAMKTSSTRTHPYKCRYCSGNHQNKKCEKAPKCNFCKKKGHQEEKCWLKDPSLKPQKQQVQASATEKHQVIEEAKLAVAYMTHHLTSSELTNKSFFVDSGSTMHFINDSTILHDSETTDYTIYSANGSIIKGTKKGFVLLAINGKTLKLNNVIYSKELSQNLLSVGQLIRDKYRVKFENNECIIWGPGDKKSLRIRAAGTIFKLEGYPVMPINKAASLYSATPTSLPVYQKIDPYYIHATFAHIGRSKVRRLIQHQAVVGLPSSFLDYNGVQFCECCIRAKHCRHSFPTSTSKTNGIGELLHADLAGPVIPQTTGKRKYILNIIDDYSKFTFTYLLHKKSDAGTAVIECIQWITNQKQCTIKTFRSDRGGEFLNHQLKSFFAENGITHQFAAPYTPEQNGVAERYNRTLFESARASLFSTSLPTALWGEAILFTTHVLNRVNITASQTKTPFELFHGIKPDISHLHPFGVKCFAKVNEHTTKLESKSTEGHLVGYEPNSKAWRIYNPASRVISITRHAIFVPDMSKSGGVMSSENDFTISEEEEENENQNDENHQPIDSKRRKLSPLEQVHNESHSPSPVHPSSPLQNRYELRSRQALCAHSISNNEPDTANSFPIISKRSNIQSFAELLVALSTDTQHDLSEPQSYQQAIQSLQKKEWISAIDAELNSLDENQTWDIVDLPSNRTSIKSKWVFKVKRDSSGEIARFKARLVAKGYSQREGIDFHETFSPVVKFSSLRLLLALAAQNDYEVEQVDFTTAFLNGTLDEEIYLEIPEGYRVANPKGKALRLRKSLYGLKQAPRQWNLALDKTLQSFGFRRLVTDEAIYHKVKDDSITIITVYVDDMLLIGNSKSTILNTINEMHSVFKLKHMGPVSFILGLKVDRNRETKSLTLNQTQYISFLATKFNVPINTKVDTPMEQGFNTAFYTNKATDVPYKEMIGSLMYAMLGTRPDIAFAIGFLCRFMSDPAVEHWKALRRVLTYLVNTKDFKLQFGPHPTKETGAIRGFSDSDFAANPADRKSTTGYIVTFYNGAISWSSKRQHRVARSTTEAEYIALSSVVAETLWLRNILIELDKLQGTNVEVATVKGVEGLDHPKSKDSYSQGVQVYGDNTASIQLAKIPKFHNRTKHFDIDYHWLREQVKLDKVQIQYLPTSEMLADALTKPLGRTQFEKFIQSIGLINSSIRGSVE
ncbi:hypothetical protein MP638_003672, partial [Amoeboaphelidium occidentale]